MFDQVTASILVWSVFVPSVSILLIIPFCLVVLIFFLVFVRLFLSYRSDGNCTTLFDFCFSKFQNEQGRDPSYIDLDFLGESAKNAQKEFYFGDVESIM